MTPALSKIGLGCSSFSHFFDPTDGNDATGRISSPQDLDPQDPRVEAWIDTIQAAVQHGITLLDTAPWYGHGVSEVVIGYALQSGRVQRQDVILQTKAGRYEADPSRQFDFSYETTIASCKRSIRRMHCDYIDVLQLHDPEFAPSLDAILECLRAMRHCREQGYCKALGLTGYPLVVQLQILEASHAHFGEHIFDQCLTYCHYNLHDTSLLDRLGHFRRYVLRILAAAPLSMGLLTPQGPPEWHPAPPALKQACRRAAQFCQDRGVDLADLALWFALRTPPHIECTILGMKSRAQVETVVGASRRDLTAKERQVLDLLRDLDQSPFADVWKSSENQWDSVAEARHFWKQVPGTQVLEWQTTAAVSNDSNG